MFIPAVQKSFNLLSQIQRNARLLVRVEPKYFVVDDVMRELLPSNKWEEFRKEFAAQMIAKVKERNLVPVDVSTHNVAIREKPTELTTPEALIADYNPRLIDMGSTRRKEGYAVCVTRSVKNVEQLFEVPALGISSGPLFTRPVSPISPVAR